MVSVKLAKPIRTCEVDAMAKRAKRVDVRRAGEAQGGKGLHDHHFVTHLNSVVAPVFALVICIPKYLGGAMSLGEVIQAAAAFVIVQGALNWFVDNYQRLADLLSSMNRVSSLLLALDQLGHSSGQAKGHLAPERAQFDAPEHPTDTLSAPGRLTPRLTAADRPEICGFRLRYAGRLTDGRAGNCRRSSPIRWTELSSPN
jgi:hypothetical protein